MLKPSDLERWRSRSYCNELSLLKSHLKLLVVDPMLRDLYEE
jgi:hypothetical protein